MDALAAADIFLFQGCRLDRRGGVLFGRDQQGVFAPIAIGRRALDILGVLVERPGDLISRDDIIEAVWPGRTVEDSNLNVQVAALRRILDDGRADGSCIQTVSGRGYRFVAPVTRVEPSTPQSGTSGGGTIAEDGQPHGPSAGVAAPTSAAPRLSIVVLPFANLSTDPDQQYFADGITEDLTTDLSRIAESFVISCNTAFNYRNKRVDTKQIGRELGVRYVLEGSVRRSSDRLRVNAQLIDAETDTHLWAERFEGDTSDMFAVQDEITSLIAIALNVELVTAEVSRTAEHPDALDYILRGRALMNKTNARDNYAGAISLFERALVFDPNSVEAQSLLARALVGRVFEDMTSSRAADIEYAEEMVERALAQFPNHPQARYAKGQLLRWRHRFDEAITEYETSLAFNRNFLNAYVHIARCKLLTGSVGEAIRLYQQAIRLSPRDPNISVVYWGIGEAHLLQSRIDDSILWFEKARSANPAFGRNHVSLAAAYALKGDTERAAFELSEARRLSGDNRYFFGERVSTIRSLYETTFFAGLRKAGMAEE